MADGFERCDQEEQQAEMTRRLALESLRTLALWETNGRTGTLAEAIGLFRSRSQTLDLLALVKSEIDRLLQRESNGADLTGATLQYLIRQLDQGPRVLPEQDNEAAIYGLIVLQLMKEYVSSERAFYELPSLVAGKIHPYWRESAPGFAWSALRSFAESDGSLSQLLEMDEADRKRAIEGASEIVAHDHRIGVDETMLRFECECIAREKMGDLAMVHVDQSSGDPATIVAKVIGRSESGSFCERCSAQARTRMLALRNLRDHLQVMALQP